MYDIESTITWDDIQDGYRDFLKQNPTLEEGPLWTPEEREAWFNRFKVPNGLSKKELNKLQKATQVKIDELKLQLRDPTLNEVTRYFIEACKEDWIGKKTRIKNNLKFHEQHGTATIQKAKDFPITQLLEFKHGLTQCIFHNDSNPSMKYYQHQNKVHCFVCNKSFDAIDIFMKINNLNFNEAIKRLS